MIVHRLVHEIRERDPTETLVLVMFDSLHTSQWALIRDHGCTVVTEGGLKLVADSKFTYIYCVNNGRVSKDVVAFLKTLKKDRLSAVYLNSTYFWNEV